MIEALIFDLTVRQTISVIITEIEPISPSYVPSLDFSRPANSGFLALFEDI